MGLANVAGVFLVTLLGCVVARYIASQYIPFRDFSATSVSIGSLLEWKIPLFHKEIFLVDQLPI